MITNDYPNDLANGVTTRAYPRKTPRVVTTTGTEVSNPKTLLNLRFVL